MGLRLLRAVLAVGVLVALLGAALLLAGRPSEIGYGREQSSGPLPDVVGVDEHVAWGRLQRFYTTVHVERRPHPSVAPGRVITTDPPPGTSSRGTGGAGPVTMIVSTGPAPASGG